MKKEKDMIREGRMSLMNDCNEQDQPFYDTIGIDYTFEEPKRSQSYRTLTGDGKQRYLLRSSLSWAARTRDSVSGVICK
ncbi:MAG: hypothetical protein SOY49_05210 [Prevotella sp.]|nr:hypothetical protein [Prevotella sp.]